MATHYAWDVKGGNVRCARIKRSSRHLSHLAGLILHHEAVHYALSRQQPMGELLLSELRCELKLLQVRRQQSVRRWHVLGNHCCDTCSDHVPNQGCSPRDDRSYNTKGRHDEGYYMCAAFSRLTDIVLLFTAFNASRKSVKRLPYSLEILLM